MAKDDAGELENHKDNGKHICLLQEEAGDISDFGTDKGLASRVEVPEQIKASLCIEGNNSDVVIAGSLADDPAVDRQGNIGICQEEVGELGRNRVVAGNVSRSQVSTKCDSVLSVLTKGDDFGTPQTKSFSFADRAPNPFSGKADNVRQESSMDVELNGGQKPEILNTSEQGLSEQLSKEKSVVENEKNVGSETSFALFDYISPPDFALLDGLSGTSTTGIAAGLVGPLVLKDRFNRWIDATAPLARELTSVAAAKAGLSVPGGIKSWLGNSWTSPSKGPTRWSLSSPEGFALEESTSASKSLTGGSPMRKVGSMVDVRSASTDSISSGSAMDQAGTPTRELTSSPDIERGNQLMLELKQSLKIVLGEAVKGDGKPLGDGVHAITLFCGLLDQALAHGLKDGRPRWASWSSGKNPLIFLNLLEALEQRLPPEPGPEHEDFRGSLGLDDVRALNWVRSNRGRLRAWIRQSLNAGLLGARLRLVVEHADLLVQWYESWGLLRRDDTSDELLSVVMALNAVQTNLSVGLGVGLDHQKYSLFENLFTLDASKSSVMKDERLMERKYPSMEFRVSTTTEYPSKHLKTMLSDEETEFQAPKLNSVQDSPVAFVDPLSPPDSPCDSPRMSSSGLEFDELTEEKELDTGIVGRTDHESISESFLSMVNDKLGTLRPVEDSALQQAGGEENLECRSVLGDHGSDESMFGVESDGDERRNMLSKTRVSCQRSQPKSQAEVASCDNDWGDFEQENKQGLADFGHFFEGLNIENDSTNMLVQVQTTSSQMLDTGMNGEEMVQHGGSIKNVEIGLSEEGLGYVKGTGRPDLDEDEDDGFDADVDEEASVLSDLEEEEYETDVEVTNLPLVSPKLEEPSCVKAGMPFAQESDSHHGSFELHLDINDGTMNAEGLCVVQPMYVSPCFATATDLYNEENMKGEVTPAESFSRMSSLSLSDETLRLESGSDVEVVAVLESSKPENLDESVGQGKFIENRMSGSPHSQKLLNVAEHLSQHTTAELAIAPKAALSQHTAVELAFAPEVFESGVVKEKGPLETVINKSGRKKGTIIRLGSKEAEELLQLDFTKMGRAILPSAKEGSVTVNSPGVKMNGVDWGADDLGPDELSRYVETLEVKETYLDTILDMEDVLLESDEDNGLRAFRPSKSMFATSVGQIERDGSLSASTSGVSRAVGNRGFQLSANHLTEVTWVEVVGARQRRGGASLGERVVGVQEHTVYRILVRGGGGREWEIERRYRDFVSLYQQLNRMYASKSSVTLPAPWDKVRAESRKLFGNTSPNVVEVRSALIQVCLQSLLQAGPPLNTSSPLLRFLFPTTWAMGTTRSAVLPRASSGDFRSTGTQMALEEFGSEQAFSPRSDTASIITDTETESNSQSVFGKTIRLIVKVHKKKPLAQQIQAQHHACAGCYRQLNLSVGLFPGLIQTLGFSGPRWCDYSGQLFCSSCHLNETAVIPAYVLQHWDFGPRPVSQLAKAYLDSIYDKPMLCVSAVNPYLYSRVPILAHLRETRKRLSKMLVCIQCPSRSRIQAMVGSRRYLLENNDFFALRDLADLSKGAFAVLPGFMKTSIEKLTAHIKRECPICVELGEPCGAINFCTDPLDIIYPFQESNIVRCTSCRLPFHKRCFTICKGCPSCSGGQSVHKLEECQAQDLASTSDSSNGLLSLAAANAPVAVDADAQVKASRLSKKNKRNFLSGLLTTTDSSRKEPQPGRQDSLVLNMSALLGPHEL